MTAPAGVLFAVAVLALLLCGCFNDIVLDVRSLGTSSDSTIVVLTSDGWQYKFLGGQYTIASDSSLQQVLQGHGKKYRRIEPDFLNFHGAIPLDGIEQVTISEATPWLYVTFGAIGLVTAAIIWLAVSLQGVNAG